MHEFENKFLNLCTDKPLVLFKDINDISFLWKVGEKELQKLNEDLNNYQPNIEFTYSLGIKISYCDFISNYAQNVTRSISNVHGMSALNH